MDPLEIRIRVRDLVEPTVDRLGYDLVAVEWTGNTGGPVLRLSIDAHGGIGADDCARVSRQVSPLLDVDDPITGAYQLEVSSPGIERPVQRVADFIRFEGHKAKIRLFAGHPRRRYSGTLAGIDGDDVRILVDGEEHRIFYDSIEAAHLVLDLDDYRQLAQTLYGEPAAEDSAHDQ